MQADGPVSDAQQSALEVISQVFSMEAAATSDGADLGTSHMDPGPLWGPSQRGRGRGRAGKLLHFCGLRHLFSASFTKPAYPGPNHAINFSINIRRSTRSFI